MGVYRDHVVPRLVHLTCGASSADRWRQRACAGLHGEVLEIGFGSGLNLPFLPPAVDRLRAVEPSDVAWRLAARKVDASRVPVERAGLDGQSLPFADDTVDTALSTWTLCTIPDPAVALREVRRVLRPGGTLQIVEHGLAPDASVRTWQHRLDPLQQRMAGGCHLTRQPLEMLRDAGFSVDELDTCYADGLPKAFGAFTVGVGTSPD